MRLISYHAVLLMTLSIISMTASAANIKADIAPFAEHSQLLVVTVLQANDVHGTLQRYEKTNQQWHKVGEPWPVLVGANGVNKQQEGDKRAPSGIYALTQLFGYAQQTTLTEHHLPYLPLTAEMVCVDDVDSPHYNRIITPTYAVGTRPQHRTWNSDEGMRRDLHYQQDMRYELGIVVAYNTQQARAQHSRLGAGSCIFLHVWKTPQTPTSGCTAMSFDNIQVLHQWLRLTAKPLLIQGVAGNLPIQLD